LPGAAAYPFSVILRSRHDHEQTSCTRSRFPRVNLPAAVRNTARRTRVVYGRTCRRGGDAGRGPYVAVTGCREASEREFDRDSRPAMAFRDLRGPMSDRAEWAAAGWTTASCVVCSARERRVPLRSIRADLIGSQLQVIVDALTAMHCPTDRGDGKGTVRHRFTNVWWISVIIHLLHATVEA
jgi:hypothetical protein